jgi:glucose/arabinose dehydrogenase
MTIPRTVSRAIKGTLCSVCACVLFFQSLSRASADPIGPYLNQAFPSRPPDASWGIVDAFPNLSFYLPVQVVNVPGQDRVAVVEKNGVVWTIDFDSNANSKTRTLDLRPQTYARSDGGLLGVAFHPNFGVLGSPGEKALFVFYRTRPPLTHSNLELGYNRVSRFEVDPVTLLAVAGSEQILIEQYDPHSWHNGGCLRFGPDGFLYISVGDFGHASVAGPSRQQIDKYLTSGILRLDVDQDPSRSHPIRRQPQSGPELPAGWPPSSSQGYYIPNDNPWLSPDGDVLEEFFAIGLRSPHRFTFDPVNGELILGDVGDSSSEEIDVIRKGDNLQWPYREGNVVKSQPPTTLIGVERQPLHTYRAGAIIGGFRYAHSRYAPSLAGKYVFADYVSNAVVALDNVGATDTWAEEPLASFSEQGIDMGLVDVVDLGDGHIYLVGLSTTGKIFRLEPLPPMGPSAPALLSQVGAFSDLATLEAAPGMVPYEVNQPLWSDGALKTRWLALPNDGVHDAATEQIGFAEYGPWQFPPGTVFVKHFELPAQGSNSGAVRLETRFLVVSDNGAAYGLTYRWNDAGTEAFLLTESETRDVDLRHADGSTSRQTWTFPSPQDCLECHNPGAGYVIGTQTWQLNRNGRDLLSSSNQIEQLLDRGMFVNPPEPQALSALPQGVSLHDSSASVEQRIDSYLAANCAQCHYEGGVDSAFDARFETPLNDVISKPSRAHGSTETLLVNPRDPWTSELYIRDASLGLGAMPPLAKGTIDDEYVALLGDWIARLTPDGCSTRWLAAAEMSVYSFDSDDPSRHPAHDAIDGLPRTVWHTARSSSPPAPPHELIVDLGATRTVRSLSYLPRQDSSTNGSVANYEVYISDDPTDFGAPVKTGTFVANKTVQHANFIPTRGRYARFVAVSSIANQPWTVVAELGFDIEECASDDEVPVPDQCASHPLPNAGWSIVAFDSEATGRHEARHCIDGRPSTVWHTEWRTSPVSGPPHEVVIDLGGEHSLNGLTQLSRQDAAINGTVADFEVYVSLSPDEWKEPVVRGRFSNTKTEQAVNFPPIVGRYVRFVALSEVQGKPTTAVSELGIITTDCQ